MARNDLEYSKQARSNPFQIKPDISGRPSKIIPFILWLAAIIWVVRVTVFIRQRAGSTFAAIDILAGIQIFMVFITIVAAVMSGRLGKVWSASAGTSIRILILYSVVCAISAIWSPLPQFSLYRGIEYGSFLLGIFVALSFAPNFVKAEKLMLLMSTVTILLSMYVAIHFSGLAVLSSLGSWHTNSFTASAAIIFCYCLGEFFRADKSRKKTLKRYGVLSLAALLLGTSTASFLGAAIGTAIIAFHYRNLVLVILSLGVFVLGAVLMIATGGDMTGIRDFVFHGMSTENIYDLHGRLPMWEIFFGLVKESPIVGYGFAVLSTGRGMIFSTSPHNSIFSVLLGTGLLGFMFAITYVFRALREFFHTSRLRLPGAIGCTAGIIAALVNSLAMPLVFDEWEESSLVFASVTAFMVLFVYLPYRRGELAEKVEPTKPRVGGRIMGRRVGK